MELSALGELFYVFRGEKARFFCYVDGRGCVLLARAMTGAAVASPRLLLLLLHGGRRRRAVPSFTS